jgi:hypothetical protein
MFLTSDFRPFYGRVGARWLDWECLPQDTNSALKYRDRDARKIYVRDFRRPVLARTAGLFCCRLFRRLGRYAEREAAVLDFFLRYTNPSRYCDLCRVLTRRLVAALVRTGSCRVTGRLYQDKHVAIPKTREFSVCGQRQAVVAEDRRSGS